MQKLPIFLILLLYSNSMLFGSNFLRPVYCNDSESYMSFGIGYSQNVLSDKSYTANFFVGQENFSAGVNYNPPIINIGALWQSKTNGIYFLGTGHIGIIPSISRNYDIVTACGYSFNKNWFYLDTALGLQYSFGKVNQLSYIMFNLMPFGGITLSAKIIENLIFDVSVWTNTLFNYGVQSETFFTGVGVTFTSIPKLELSLHGKVGLSDIPHENLFINFSSIIIEACWKKDRLL